MQRQGVTAVLSLQTEEDFQSHGVNWAALRARYFAVGVEVRRVPIRDFDDQDLLEKLPQAVQVLGELLAGDHRVFVHCNAGVNRSPSVVICYLHWSQGWSLDRAEQYVMEHHPCAPVMDVIRRATWDRQRQNRS